MPTKENKKVQDLRPNPRNPRKITDPQLKRLGQSLREFGDMGGLVVNTRTGNLVGGHQRIKHLDPSWPIIKRPAADKTGTTARGYVKTPMGNLDYREVDWDEVKETAGNIAANAQGGDWDDSALAKLLAELNGKGCDMALTGFSESELKKLISYGGKSGLTDPDDAPEAPRTTDTKRGDLFLLGDSKLLCGDSTKPEDVSRLMDGKKADLFVTDPPYFVDYTGKDRPLGCGKDWSGIYHETEIKDAAAFCNGFIKSASEHLADNAAWYCWHACWNAHIVKKAWENNGAFIHQQIIWVKPTAVVGYSFYPWRHEPAWFGWKKGNKPPRDGVKNFFTTVWNLGWEGKRRLVGNEHPTQKPVEIFSIPMARHTQKGAICYEPFSGSGSQIIAGEKMGRRVFAMEIEPVFVDVAVRRWEAFTGLKAEKK